MEHFVWDAIPKEVLSPTIARKIITGEKAMVAQVFIAKGGIVPLHHHESEQITYILEGALDVRSAGAFLGVMFAVLLSTTDDPAADFVSLIDAGLAHLEAGLPL